MSKHRRISRAIDPLMDISEELESQLESPTSQTSQGRQSLSSNDSTKDKEPNQKKSRFRIPKNCKECTKRKVKCDRKRPTCSSCSQRQTECSYFENTKDDTNSLLEALKNENVNLRKQVNSLLVKRNDKENNKNRRSSSIIDARKKSHASQLGHYLNLKKPNDNEDVTAAIPPPSAISRLPMFKLVRMLDSSPLVAEIAGIKESELIRKEYFSDTDDIKQSLDSNNNINSANVNSKPLLFPFVHRCYRGILSFLILQFVNRVHFFCPIYPVNEVEKRFDSMFDEKNTNPISIALVLSILALSARTLNSENLQEAMRMVPKGEVGGVKLKDLSTATTSGGNYKDDYLFDMFSERALQFFDIGKGEQNATADGIACLVFLQIAESFKSHQAICSPTKLGVIVQLAYSIGLHREPSHFIVDKLDAEIRRRLWYQILSMDYSLSSSRYRPTLVSKENYDTRPPSDFEGSRQIIGVILLFRTLATESYISKLITTTNWFYVSYDEVLTFDKRLHAALSERNSSKYRLREDYSVANRTLSNSSNLVDGSSSFSSRSALWDEIISFLIEFRMQHAIMQLHRPFYRAYTCRHFKEFYDPKYSTSRDATLQISRNLVELTIILLSNEKLRDMYGFITDSACLFYGLDGAYTLALGIAESQDENTFTDKDFEILGQCMRLVDGIVSSSNVSRRGRFLLSHLFDLIRKRFPAKASQFMDCELVIDEYPQDLGLFYDDNYPDVFTSIDDINQTVPDMFMTPAANTTKFNPQVTFSTGFDELAAYEEYYGWVVSTYNSENVAPVSINQRM